MIEGELLNRPKIDLATGEYLLFFSDIEGSTKLVQSLGDRYVDVLVRQQDIVREAVQARNGRVIGTEGDSFFVVFRSADDGFRAALAVQRALSGESWPEEVAVKVRIGIHFGIASSLGDELVGLDLHRAARVSSAAHGGQTVLTQEVVDALSKGTVDDEGVTLRGLGRHNLKDLRYPETLFDVEYGDLPSLFPAVRSINRRITNMTSAPREVFGRDRELAEIQDLLASHPGRLVTLLGIGGVGKTALAERIALASMESFPDGVFFVKFETTMDPALAFASIADVLGVQDFPSRSLKEDVAAAIGQGHVLLVLDTFEHLTASAGDIAALLAACPNLRILVTSQATLGLAEEREYAIEPLGTRLDRGARFEDSAAAQLFMARVHEFDPAFEATDDNRKTLIQIVKRLEGLPLALEIAASQLKLLGPEQLLDRLASRARTMRSGKRDVARHRTLRDAVSWSDQLLSDDEREVFHKLSVFAGGFSIDDAEDALTDCLDGNADVFDAVATLVSRSLLRRITFNGEPRFRMLDLVREYSQEELDNAGLLARTKNCHLKYYAEKAAEHGAMVMHKRQRRHVEWLDSESDNLRFAMQTAIDNGDVVETGALIRSLYWYWISQGHFTEGLRWIDQAAPLLAADDGSAGAADLNTAAAYTKAMAGDYAAAFVHGRAAEEVFVALGDDHKAAQARLIHAVGGVASGQIEDPSAMMGSSMEVFTKHGDGFFHALGLTIGGELSRMVGDREGAEAAYRAASEMFVDLSNTFWQGAVSMNMGHVRLGFGDVEAARTAFSEALGLGEDHGYSSVICASVAGLAGVAVHTGDAETCALILAGVNQRMESIGAKFEPTDQAENDGYFAMASETLGDEGIERARSEAAVTNWDDICDKAREIATA